MLMFQDKDYREERKKVHQIITQQQQETFQAQANMIQGRQKRQAAMLNYQLTDAMMYDFGNSNVHDLKKKSKDEEHKAPQQKKDRTIRIPKLYEF